MRKLVAVLMAAGVMAAAGTAISTPAEAHWRKSSCCAYYKKVRYYKPVTKIVKRVTYVRVRGYRTVYARRLYRDRCCCRRYYRTVAYRKPYVRLVPRVRYYRVRAYRPYVVRKRYRRRCCW